MLPTAQPASLKVAGVQPLKSWRATLFRKEGEAMTAEEKAMAITAENCILAVGGKKFGSRKIGWKVVV